MMGVDNYKSRLKSKRTEIGMTQAQLAEASGVNIRQIQRVESGKSSESNMTAKNLLAIADALDIDLHSLLGE